MERSIFRSIAILSIFICGLSCSSWARSAQGFPQLLTYKGLISLSPTKRRAYVSEVRKILADFQSSMDRKLSQKEVAEIKEMHRQLHLFELLLPMAEAQGSITKKLIPRIVTDAGDQSVKRWACDESASLEFNLDVGTCVIKGRRLELGSPCPKESQPSSVKITVPTGDIVKAYCVPDDSWNALNPARREILKKGMAPGLSQFFEINSNSGDTKRNMLSQDMVLGGASEDEKNLATNGILPEETVRDRINKAAASGLAKGLPEKPPQIASVGQDVVSELANQKSQGACQPEFKCSDITKEEKKNLRTQLRGDLCIAGGNFSKYRGGKPQPGGCETMKHWPSDNNKKLSCTGANEAMCNPFLYCLDGEKKPFCFKPTQTFTAQCEKAGDAVKCDPARIQGLGFQDEWTDLRDKFSLVVGEKCLLAKGGAKPAPQDLAFQKFFCSECQAITDRLYGANFKTVGNGCGIAKVDQKREGTVEKRAQGVSPTSR